MAGLLLPALVPLGVDGESGGAVTRPVLALLGGFSAAVLYRVLERLVSTVETLVRTDPRQVQSAQQEVAAARSAEATATERVALVSELRRLQDQARAGGAGRVADGIEELVDDLLPARLGNGRPPGDAGHGPD
jgi:hypothetical protein